MVSIEKSLKDRNSSFSAMLREFSIWCYYTGFLKQQGLFFEEGELYPEYEAMITSNFSSSILSDSINTAPASISVIRYCKNNGITKDTISILISNGDYYNAAHDPGKTSKVVVRATTYEMPNSISLSGKYFLFYNHFQATEISEETIFNNSAAGWVLTSQMVYPNPYKLQSTTLPFICIPVPQNDYESEADFNVYNAAMQLVYSGKKSVLLNIIKWNLKSEHFVTLGTGVYFYIIKTTKNTFTGKFTIING
ncbi:MAG: T9SS type A sorting domain-containing protein [Ignavibacteriales bacterium]|nr:T9SS type A sorting domain-containing protein [Ignavibacteriales bacterium]